MNTIRLGTTASLVMQWAQSFYTYPQTQKYITFLDMDQGRKLLEECQRICPWYDQVILNRKHALAQSVDNIITQTGTKTQIVIPAAGFAPLGLELLLANRELIQGVWEMDLYGMEDKQRMYHKAAPELSKRITCINQNIANGHFSTRSLEKAGWNPALTTIMIVEGISYYLNHSDMLNLLKPIANHPQQNYALIEYLLPAKHTTATHRDFGNDVFNFLTNYCKLPFITRYTLQTLLTLLDPLKATPGPLCTMHELEHNRTGQNCYFSQKNSGWIEVATLNFQPLRCGL